MTGMIEKNVPNYEQLVRESVLNPKKTRETRSKSAVFNAFDHSQYIRPPLRGLKGILIVFQSPILLLSIGIFSSLLGIIIDACIECEVSFRRKISDSDRHYRVFYYLFFTVGFAVLSSVLVYVICPKASGSGLPQIKVAISGVVMEEYLTCKGLVAKFFGLITAYAGGLSIGKEGPLIMMTCAFAHNLMQLNYFKRIRVDRLKHSDILACACAAGVAATFGTPFGAVLFSVEVTSNHYLVRNLPRAFFASIVGASVAGLLQESNLYGLFRTLKLGLKETAVTRDVTVTDLLLFLGIGILCGGLGAIFISIISYLVRLREMVLHSAKKKIRWWATLGKCVLLVAITTLIVNVCEYYGNILWGMEHSANDELIANLFSKGQLNNIHTLYFFSKFLITAVCVTLPIPAGIFAPTFVIGGILGRLLGQINDEYGFVATNYKPFEFAIIGAASFSSGVTRAISTAVIVTEIIHNNYLTIPISVAILAAYFTGGRFTENVYDVLISTNKHSRLKKLPKAAYDIPAWEAMDGVNSSNFLTAGCTYGEVKKLLSQSNELVFPIVDNKTNMLLLASVARFRLETAVQCIEAKEASMEVDGMKSITMKKSVSSSSRFFDKSEEQLIAAGKSRSVTVADSNESSISVMNWSVQFAVERGGNILLWGSFKEVELTDLTILLNPSPYLIMETMTMNKVDLMFRMLKVSHVFVARCGKLVGMISRRHLMYFLGTTRKYKQRGLLNIISEGVRNLFHSRGDYQEI